MECCAAELSWVEAVTRAIACLVACCCLLCGAPAIAAARLAWSPTLAIAEHDGAALNAVACPAADLCVAVDNSGGEVTFDPQRPGVPAPTTIDPGSLVAPTNPGVKAVACPSTTQCTAVDGAGGEVTFDPADPGKPKRVSIDGSTPLRSIACPLVAECVAVDGDADAITFDPMVPGSAKTSALDLYPIRVVCPAATQCTAVDGYGYEVTFDPRHVGRTKSVLIDVQDNSLPGLACLSRARCVAVDVTGAELTFDPDDPGTPKSSIVDPSGHVRWLTCSGSAQCLVVDNSGQEVTFDPDDPSVSSADRIDATGDGLYGVTCSSIAQCVAVDRDGGEVTFDPTASGAPARMPRLVDTIGPAGHAVTCPSAHQCTVLDESSGYAVTFDPEAPRGRRFTTVIKGGPATGAAAAIDCPSVSECVAISNTVPSNAYYLIMSETTFDPRTSRVEHSGVVGRDAYGGTNGVACPSITLCVELSTSERVTFDPLDPAKRTSFSVGEAFSGGYSLSFACASRRVCAAADYDNAVLAFNPHAPAGGGGTSLSSRNGWLESVACPSVNQCTTVAGEPGLGGYESTFDPARPARAKTVVINKDLDLIGVACATVRECVIVDSSDLVGEGNPQTAGSWRLHPISHSPTSGYIELQDVSCPSPMECVAVDANGQAFVAR